MDFILLKDELKKWNINIGDIQIEKFERYFELLIFWNEKINLTSIIDKDAVIYKHFIDSIALMNFEKLSGKSLIDVGTGAGFPGMPIAILNPECEIYLIDSLNKRINFLNEVIYDLKLSNVKTFHGRAEDFGHDKNFREKFDFSVSRAVANLSTLSEYCLPFVKQGGFFVSYKSEQTDEEINSSEKALRVLGGNIKSIKSYNLPYNGGINNRLIFIEKTKYTPKLYPRKAGTPTKSPL